jgi:hypothetical protein
MCSVGSILSLYNEDPRPVEGIEESSYGVDSWQLWIKEIDKSSAQAAVTRGPDSGMLKILHS